MRNRQINPMLAVFIVLLVYNSFRAGAYSSPTQWLMFKLLMLPGIIIGLAFHEYAHAIVAFKLGDPTPKMQGRVTINPVAHIDWLGFAALLLCGFGWGQPVEINPWNFKNRRRDELLVSVAGVAMNLLIAIIFAFIAKGIYMAAGPNILSVGMGNIVWQMIINVIFINLVLMIFNLIPCPPLDGFSIVGELFNLKTTELYWNIYKYGNLILLALILFDITDMILSPAVSFCFNLLQNLIIF
ncbi:MAG: site-2 protease family protein [Eubacterium sp.]|nr:site-2 protease family protein [Candidatus Colimonas fimequi]